MKVKFLNIIQSTFYIFIWITIIYYHYLYINIVNPFKIETIKISGNKFIHLEDIDNSINDLIYNKNLLNVEFEKIQKKISEIKFINSVKIYHEIPSTIKIDIIEKKPIALINDKKNNYFIDNNKDVIKADIKSINYFVDTPIISTKNKNFDIALSKNLVLSIYNSNFNLYKQLNEIIYQDNDIRLFFNNNTEVKFKISNYKNGLIKLFSFVKQISPAEKLEKYEYIDLSINNQVIVKEKKIKT